MGKIMVRQIVGRPGFEHLDQEFEIDAHPGSGSLSETQRRVNELMGVKDEDVLIVNAKEKVPDYLAISETQRRINRMMGIDDATFRKYNP